MTTNIPGFGPQALNLSAGTLAVQGGYTAPSWWTQMTGEAPAPALGVVQLNPLSGYFGARVLFPGEHSIPAGGSRMKLPQLFFGIAFTPMGLSVSAGGLTELNVDAMGGATQTAPMLSFALSYDAITQNVSGTFQFQAAGGWDDAFGVDGLVLNDLAISLGVTLVPPIPIPTIGLYASGVLPPSLTQAFGVDQGVPVSVTAQLSATNPCLSVQAGSSVGTVPIMSIGSGATGPVTARLQRAKSAHLG